jgi:hypothetical protein
MKMGKWSEIDPSQYKLPKIIWKRCSLSIAIKVIPGDLAGYTGYYQKTKKFKMLAKM